MWHAPGGNGPRYYRRGNDDQQPIVGAERTDTAVHARHTAAVPKMAPAASDGRRLERWRRLARRRMRRVIVVSTSIVAIGIAVPVTAYACGFTSISERPVLARTASPWAAQNAAAASSQSDRSVDSTRAAAAQGRADEATRAARAAVTPSASASATTAATATSTPSASASSSASASTENTSSGSGGIFGLPLYDALKPYADSAGISTAAVQQQIDSKTVLGRIASFPSATWITDGHAGFQNDISTIVTNAAADKSVATLVAYNIPHRDCGQYSAGGASDAAAYRSWIDTFVSGLGSHKAIIIIEPDAIGLAPNCLNASERAERYALIKYAADKFEAQGSWAYIDAGNSAWLSVGDITTALKASGIDEATGFALNTAQSRPDSELLPYGDKVSAAVGGKHFVVDSSRNGIAPAAGNYEWCNPSGKGLGHRPTTDTGHSLLDAFLWIKTPGGSDGNCNGGGNAGSWFESYAAGLLANAHLEG